MLEHIDASVVQESGILVGVNVDLYEVIDIITNEPITVLDVSDDINTLKSELRLKINHIKTAISHLNDSHGKLDFDTLVAGEFYEHELTLFLKSQESSTYKPFFVRDLSDLIDAGIVPKLKELANESLNSNKKFKIDFVYGEGHHIAVSIRVEGGDIHIATIDYIRSQHIDAMLPISDDIKGNLVYHSFYPKENDMQVDLESCGILASYALKDLSQIPTQDLDKYIKASPKLPEDAAASYPTSNEDMNTSDYKKLSPALIRLCQVISILNKYIAEHPDAKVTHKNKAPELLSDYVKRHTYDVVADLREDSPKLVKTNIAVYKKTIKVYKTILTYLDQFKTDREITALLSDEELTNNGIKIVTL